MSWLVWEDWLFGCGVAIVTFAALYALVRLLHCLVPDEDQDTGEPARPCSRPGEPPACMCCNCGQYETC